MARLAVDGQVGTGRYLSVSGSCKPYNRSMTGVSDLTSFGGSKLIAGL